MRYQVISSLLTAALAATAASAQEPAKAPAKEPAKEPPTDLLDIYQPPQGKRLLGNKEMLQLIVERSLAIKKIREQLTQARIGYRQFKSSLLPSGSFSASTSTSASSSLQTVFDPPPDPTLPEPGPEREVVTSGKSRSVSAGVGINGALPGGISYGFSSIPRVSRTDTLRPRGQTEPSYDVAYNASLGVQLLKGSVFVDRGNEFQLQDLTLRGSRLDAERAFLTAIIEGQTAFYDLVRQDLQMALARRTSAQAKQLLEDTRARREIGELDRLSMLAAELQFAQSSLQMRKQESEYQKSREAIREKLGLTPEEFDSFYPDVRIFRDPPARPALNADELLAVARERRPDWLKQRGEVTRAEIAVARARAALLPQLSFDYGHGWSRSGKDLGPPLKEALDYRSRSQSMGLSLSYPLWGGGERDSLRTAESQAANASIAAQETWRQIEKEIRSLVEDLDLAFDQLALTGTSRSLAEQRAEAERLKFKVGEVSIKAVVDAEKDVVNTRLDELTNKMSLSTTLMRLDAAVGKTPEGIGYDF